MEELCSGRCRLAVVDLDGVVWRGLRAIPGNIEGLQWLAGNGVEVFFATNNATRSRRLYKLLIDKVVKPTYAYRVLTSAYAAARWVTRALGREKLVYVVGGPGLVEEAVVEGHIPVTAQEVKRCLVDAVLVGLDHDFSYHRLSTAYHAVRDCGARLVAANTDKTIPVDDGAEPGAGSIVAALAEATGATPVVVGKPDPYMARLAMEEVGASAEETVVIGDRVETDMELAGRLGAHGVLVLTGVTREPRLPETPPKTMWVCPDLASLKKGRCKRLA